MILINTNSLKYYKEKFPKSNIKIFNDRFIRLEKENYFINFYHNNFLYYHDKLPNRYCFIISFNNIVDSSDNPTEATYIKLNKAVKSWYLNKIYQNNNLNQYKESN